MSEQTNPSLAEPMAGGDAAAEPYGATVVRAVRQITKAIGEHLSAGEVANLRRLDPERPSAGAFWKLIAEAVEPAGLVRQREEERDEDERRWAAVIGAIVQLGPSVRPTRRLGEALAAAELAELRFVKLLRARGEALREEVRRTAQILAVKGEAVDPVDLAWLVLSDGRGNEETVRRQVARDYYRHLKG